MIRISTNSPNILSHNSLHTLEHLPHDETSTTWMDPSIHSIATHLAMELILYHVVSLHEEQATLEWAPHWAMG